MFLHKEFDALNMFVPEAQQKLEVKGIFENIFLCFNFRLFNKSGVKQPIKLGLYQQTYSVWKECVIFPNFHEQITNQQVLGF